MEADEIKRKGLASSISIVCHCGYVKGYASKIAVDESHTAKKGTTPFEINARIVYVLRNCGLGYAALERLCCIMNMTKPMTVVNFDKITNKI